jgi:hypothetical protein
MKRRTASSPREPLDMSNRTLRMLRSARKAEKREARIKGAVLAGIGGVMLYGWLKS